MSQGYSYTPPTLDEAIKAYRRAKHKAAIVESFSRQRYQPKQSFYPLPPAPNEETVPHPQIYPRRRGYSHGNISEVDDLDDNETVDEFPVRSKLRPKMRRNRNVAPPKALIPTDSFPAWSNGYTGNGYPGYPGNSNNPHQPMPPAYPNMFLPQPFPNISMMPGPYGMYPQYVPHQHHPYNHNYQQQPYATYYNMQPAERMNYRDFERDCKHSPTPSRPYSDSDLLETLSNRGKGFHESDKFTVIPPIPRMGRNDAAQVIQRNFRGYQEKKRSVRIKDKFYVDFVDKLIDGLLVEELLPDLLVEVLLYPGTSDVKLPSVLDRVVGEHAEDLLNEFVHEMLHVTINFVMSEMISVYSADKVKDRQGDVMLYVVDELISLQIREVIQEFMKEYILEFQCERVFNQLVFEECSVLVLEVCSEEGVH